MCSHIKINVIPNIIFFRDLLLLLLNFYQLIELILYNIINIFYFPVHFDLNCNPGIYINIWSIYRMHPLFPQKNSRFPSCMIHHISTVSVISGRYCDQPIFAIASSLNRAGWSLLRPTNDKALCRQIPKWHWNRQNPYGDFLSVSQIKETSKQPTRPSLILTMWK